MERPISPSAGRSQHVAEGAFRHLQASRQHRDGGEERRSPPHTARNEGQRNAEAETQSRHKGDVLYATYSPGSAARETGSWSQDRPSTDAIISFVDDRKQTLKGYSASPRVTRQGHNAVPSDLWPRRANASSRMLRPTHAIEGRPGSAKREHDDDNVMLTSAAHRDEHASREQSDPRRSDGLSSEETSHDTIDHGQATQQHRRAADDVMSENASSQNRLRRFLPLVASAPAPSSSSRATHQPSDARGGAPDRGISQHVSSSLTSFSTAAAQGQSAEAEQAAGSQPAISLDGFARVRDGQRYKLVVVQHPERARMCGYGDKDRRPLSPSLIVKLIVTEERTGTQISPWDINTSLFFLASDLCDPDELMRAPRNLLLNTQLASIPAAMLQETRSYETPRGEGAAAAAAMTGSLNYASLHNAQQTGRGPMGERYGHGISSVLRDDRASASRMSALPPPPRSTSSGITPLSAAYEHQQQYHQQQQQLHDHRAQTATVTTEHYARNLVGAAVTSANILRDEKDEYQIFFVLQDLSVRAEGTYRIRLLFTDLAQRQGGTNEGVSEALAEAYTEPFSVYTPRRFPGMLEPTELSKKLASQGIKIAVRSDKKKRDRDTQDDEMIGQPSGSRGERVSGEAAAAGPYSESIESGHPVGEEVDELEDDNDD